MDRVSTAGYALGYVGGGLLLALNLAWIQKPEWFGLPHGAGLDRVRGDAPARLAFLSVAVWWLVFSIPLFRRVPEPPRRLEPDEARGESSVPGRVRPSGRDLPRAARLSAGVPDAPGVPDLQRRHRHDHPDGDDLRDRDRHRPGRRSSRRSCWCSSWASRSPSSSACWRGGSAPSGRSSWDSLAYTGISVLGYFMTTATHFFVLAALVGMVQGGTQALSRSLFAEHDPAAQVGGVLRLLQRVREVRRDLRPRSSSRGPSRPRARAGTRFSR